MKNLIFILIIYSLLGCAKTNEIAPKGILKYKGKTYPLSFAYFRDYEKSWDPNLNYLQMIVSSQSDFDEDICANCKSQRLKIDLFTKTNKPYNGTFLLEGHTYFTFNILTIYDNGKVEEITIKTANMELEDKRPNFKLKINGTTGNGESIICEYNGYFNER